MTQAEGRSQYMTVQLLPSEESATVRAKDLGDRDEAPPAAEEGQEKRAHNERRRKPDAGGDGVRVRPCSCCRDVS